MKIISRSQLKSKGINYCPDHLRRLEKAGKFPKSFSLVPGGPRSHDEDEIDAFLKAKADARSAA